ncbi:MAG: preprotein translocase subunit SecY [Clostridiales bacterium]|nr:preprotein translocase subunit SecY [Clostridiales bacterium]
MLQSIRNAWKIEDIRKKFIFMCFILLLYRLGNAVPVPYVNTAELTSFFQSMRNTVLGLYNVMSGSAFSQATIFAMSIQPYINASIIIQLLAVAIPALERLQKEGGEEGKQKLERITRYSTLAIAAIQGYGYYALLSYGYADAYGTRHELLTNSGAWAAVVIIASFAAGSCLLMWMGEQITEFGLGNGISIILFVSIISRFPNQIISMVQSVIYGTATWWSQLLLLIGALLLIVLIVIVTDSERRIPVQYAKRVVGRKMYGGQSTHLPLKLNMSGVMPIIFAQSIASIPATIASFVPKWREGWFVKAFDTNTAVYMVVYFLLIVFFSYFYSTIQFNPVEVANNLKKNGGFIPGFRPGKPTSEHLQKVLSKVTLFGAVYLGIIALAPLIVGALMPSQAGISFGGTSIIIVVGVALETVRQVEAQMLMRHYKGFLE